MKALAFLIVLLLVFVGVAAYELNQRGLVNRETLGLLSRHEPEPAGKKQAPIRPVGLAASIQEKEQRLKEESEELRELAGRLEMQRNELTAERIAIEEQLKALKSVSEAEAAAEREQAKKLIKMYEGMPPEEAAAVLENLPDGTVADILSRMRGRQAAQIMGSLSARKAAEITELLASQKPESSG